MFCSLLAFIERGLVTMHSKVPWMFWLRAGKGFHNGSELVNGGRLIGRLSVLRLRTRPKIDFRVADASSAEES